MINDNENNIKNRYKYICPYYNCQLIPEVLNVHSESGTILLKCDRGHLSELDILEYSKILDEKDHLNPEYFGNEDFESRENDIINSSRKKIFEKEKELLNIIKFNKLILNAQNVSPNNYNYSENLINIEKSIKEERSINSKLDDIVKEDLENKKKEEKQVLNILKEKYYINLEKSIEKEELHLKLKGPRKETNYKNYLRDDGFKLISKLIFKNLIEINLANNYITNLNPLDNMLLPHLKIINFSDNKIKDITPLANLFSENLSEIYLQNNKIQDLGPFLNSEFPLLDIFRVDGEGNKNAFERESFKGVQKKYENIIYYGRKNWDYFNKEYHYYGNEMDYNNIIKLDLSSRKKDKILIDLFPLIIDINKIKYLILEDNKLNDASLLTKMYLYNLEFLDLSFNFITNIKFMKKISKKFKKIKALYLNDNKINNISPLIGINQDGCMDLILKLEVLTLKNNDLDLKDKATKDILKILFYKSELNIDYEKDIF